MKRLTKMLPNQVIQTQYSEYELGKKLAEYEDLGLEPVEIEYKIDSMAIQTKEQQVYIRKLEKLVQKQREELDKYRK